MPNQMELSGLFFHTTNTPPWLFRLVKVSTSSELYPDYFHLHTFFDCQAFSFLIHLSFSNTVSQATFGYLPLAVQCLCDLRDIIPRHWSPGASHPAFIHGSGGFPWGNKYFKHVLLLTCLIYVSPKGVYMVGPIYVLQSPHRTLISLPMVLNQCLKRSMC